MKTTVEIEDALLIEAKKRAIEERSTLRALIEAGLRLVLARQTPDRVRRPVAWVTVEGGLPPGIDPADREGMHEHLGGTT